MKQFTKEQVLKAVENSNGFINDVAKELNCNWHTAEKAVNKWPETIEALESKTGHVMDQAEQNIFNAIQAGDLNISKWILTTPKAKSRGYNQTTPAADIEQKIADIINILFDDLTKEPSTDIFESLNGRSLENLKNLMDLLKVLKH